MARLNKIITIITIALAFVGCSAATPPHLGPIDSKIELQLKVFFSNKELQAGELAGRDAQKTPPADIWQYFTAAQRGDWKKVATLYGGMAQTSYHFDVVKVDDRLTSPIWQPLNETYRAYEQLSAPDPKFMLSAARDIMDSIPPESVYFDGTDPGRFLVTFLSKDQIHGKPFFVLTQNALADLKYCEYLQEMYGNTIHILTEKEASEGFNSYMTEVKIRALNKRLKPGEDYQIVNGQPQASGRAALMGINEKLVKTIFEKNPNRKFFLNADAEYAMEWVYPLAKPHGLILQINHTPTTLFDPAIAKRDHDFWSHYVGKLIGDWLKPETSVEEVIRFIEKVYLKKDLTGFQGDAGFVRQAKTWRELPKQVDPCNFLANSRTVIAGLYAWRAKQAATPFEADDILDEADYAFRQAIALCPYQYDAVSGYLTFLQEQDRLADAVLVAQSYQKFYPANKELEKTLDQLKKRAAEQ